MLKSRTCTEISYVATLRDSEGTEMSNIPVKNFDKVMELNKEADKDIWAKYIGNSCMPSCEICFYPHEKEVELYMLGFWKVLNILQKMTTTTEEYHYIFEDPE